MDKRVIASLSAAVVSGAALCGVYSSVLAQEAPRDFQGTTKAASSSLIASEAAIGNILPSRVISNAQYGSGAVGLRNFAGGSVQVSGIVRPVKAAYLYWAVLTNGAAPAATKTITVQRTLPTASAAVAVAGTVVGTGPTPCWGGTSLVTVYRASVPLSVANGAGTYSLKLQPGASGSTAGGDPWGSKAVAPLMEGATLVIAGTGGATVSFFDVGLAGKTFFGSQSYALTLPVPVTRLIWMDNIGADGQVGSSRTATVAKETTIINGVRVAGPGSVANDSDWNGAAAGPLPQLWDTTGHDVTAAAPPGTTSLAVSVDAGGDCVVPVANVVASVN